MKDVVILNAFYLSVPGGETRLGVPAVIKFHIELFIEKSVGKYSFD
jgi:hypothetical protein